MKALLAALAVAAWISSAAPQSSPISAITLEPLQVRELDLDNGQWRQVNLFRGEFFRAWNWRWNERGGSHDDLQIVVTMTGPPATKPSVPLEVKVSRRGKVIDKRLFADMAFSQSGKIYEVIYLRDMACSGPADVVAIYGTQTRKLTLGTECGE